MNERRPFVALVTAAAALCLTGAAGSTIVPGKSIAGAKLTLTRPEIKDKLGAPKTIKHGSNEFGKFML